MSLTLTDKSKKVWQFLMDNQDEDYTAADIAIAMGMADADDEEAVKAATKSINGIVTGGLIRGKDYVKRVPAEIETAEGKKDVKLIVLTDAGKAYDEEAAKAADAAAKAEKAE